MVIGDSPCIPTGSGKLIRDMFKICHESDDYDFVQFAWWHQIPMEKSRWPLIVTKRAEGQNYAVDREDKYGEKTLMSTVELLRPNLVIAVGDPWMMDSIIAAKQKVDFRLVWYSVVDGAPLNSEWYRLKSVDKVIPATEWGRLQMRRYFEDRDLPFEKIGEPIPHPIDVGKYTPNKTVGMKVKETLASNFDGMAAEDVVLMITVCRNQFRKGIPYAMQAFWAIRSGQYSKCPCGYVSVWKLDMHQDGRMSPANHLYCPECGKPSSHFEAGTAHPEFYFYLHTPQEEIKLPPEARGSFFHLNDVMRALGMKDHLNKFSGILVSERNSVQGLSERDLIQVYRAADIFVLPTMGEGWGQPLTEAMACGIPTVTTNATSSAEVVEGGGVLVDPIDWCFDTSPTYPRVVIDVNKLARELLHLEEDPDHRSIISEKGLAKVAEYELVKTNKKMAKVIDEELVLCKDYADWQEVGTAL